MEKKHYWCQKRTEKSIKNGPFPLIIIPFRLKNEKQLLVKTKSLGLFCSLNIIENQDSRAGGKSKGVQIKANGIEYVHF